MAPKRSKKPVALSIIFGFVVAFVALGLPMIGVTVNLWLGSIALLAAFALLAYGFVRWEKITHWPEWFRISTVWFAAICCALLVGHQIRIQYRKDHIASPRSATPPLAQSMPSETPSATDDLEHRPTPSTIPSSSPESTPKIKERTKPTAGVESSDNTQTDDTRSTRGSRNTIHGSADSFGKATYKTPEAYRNDVHAAPGRIAAETHSGVAQQPLTYQQTCQDSACAQGPGSHATFNRYGVPQPIPKFSWKVEAIPPPEKSGLASSAIADLRPEVQVTILLDGDFYDPGFVATCNVPCNTRMVSIAGVSQESDFAPDVMSTGIHYTSPYMLPKGTSIRWLVSSNDETPVRVKNITAWRSSK